MDEAEEVRSGDEETVEPEEEPEGIINQNIFNHICKIVFYYVLYFIFYDCRRRFGQQ